MDERRERAETAMPGLFGLMPRTRNARLPARDPSDPGHTVQPCWYAAADGREAVYPDANHRTTPARDPLSYRCVPHFFLLGQVKCGTTDLYAKLSKHPEVYSASVKEQHFFSREWYDGKRYIQQYARGASQIASGSKLLLGDGTPDTFWAFLRCLNKEFKYPHDYATADAKVRTTIPEVIAELNPHARLVVILRNPVSRLWSDFFYFAERGERDIKLPRPADPAEFKRNPTKLVNASHFDAYVKHGIRSFQKCADSGKALAECVWSVRTLVHSGPTRMAMGCYGPYIEQWLKHFPREQLLVLTLDEYHANPKATLAAAYKHIGARDLSDDELGAVVGDAQKKVNEQKGKVYVKLAMMEHTKVALTQFYAQCNSMASELLGGDNRMLAWS